MLSCLSSIFRTSQDLNIEIIVIDNDSKDDSPKIIRKLFPSIILVENHANLGFAAASNQGLRIMNGDYALLLNPDTEVLDSTLQEMLKFMKSYKRVGILGCKILDKKGNIQKSAFPSPSILGEINDILCKFKLEKILPTRLTYRRYHDFLKDSHQPFKVGWVSGACLMIRKETIWDIGLLDENFFLFSEDVDWCVRAAKRGWEVMCHPAVSIVHYVGGSSKINTEEMAIRIEHHYRRRPYFAKKYFGIIGLIIIKLVMCFDILGRMVVVSLNLKPSINQQGKKIALKAYKSALKSVLGLGIVFKPKQ
ncbi:MAG: glycosyltransferase family 2 protein [candidate division Zixibacteria bacterium]|nr:glycosyltransferase family 2 protein [candidate division Zixibacteria bacterium]